MDGKRFRLKSATLGIEIVDGQHRPVTLPAHAVVELVGGPAEGGPLLEISWDSKRLFIFTQDLHTRGQEI